MKTRRGNRKDGATKIELSSIHSTSTCISLGLGVRDLYCDNCKTQFDAQIGMSKKSSAPTKRFRCYEKDGRNRCQQPWASRHCRPTSHVSTLKKFHRIRSYLNINTTVEIGGEDVDVDIENVYCDRKLQKINPPESLNNHNHELEDNSNTESLNDNSGDIPIDATQDEEYLVNDEPSDPPSEEQSRMHILHNADAQPTRSSRTNDNTDASTANNHFEVISKSALSRFQKYT